MSNESITEKISQLEFRLRDVTRKKGEAASEGGGWHDNPNFDILDDEEMTIREQIRTLKERMYGEV